jgi:hypothetical protein
MTKCNCVQCDCTVEGLHEYVNWVCPFCKGGNHLTENKMHSDVIKK